MNLEKFIKKKNELDVGFKNYILSESNFKIWNESETSEEGMAEQLEFYKNNIKDNAVNEDLVNEIVLNSGYPLTSENEKINHKEKSIYSFNKNKFIILVEKEVNQDLLDYCIGLNPEKITCLDIAFENKDVLKLIFHYLLKQNIIFKLFDKFFIWSNQQHRIGNEFYCRLFNGQQKIKYSNDFKLEDSFEVICSNPNTLTISSEVLTNNLLDIQSKNQIESLIDLNEPDKNDKKNFEFTVEMETGTGKTYIYLRSIYELNKHYGFSKFVIIVPSLAIKEGVIQTYEQTKNHFKNLYKDINVEFNVLNTNKLSSVRNFCNSNSIQVMLINIDLINKIGTGSSTTTNKMYTIQESFSSSAPIEFIKSTNPVIFLDEPQKLSGIKSKKGIENLNGIFSIGFSATPKYNKNLIYQLSPIDAFNNGLVKKIHVAGIINESSSDIYLDLKSIKSIKNNLIAEIEVDFLNTSNEYEKKVIPFKVGDSIEDKSNNQKYKGLMIEDIDKVKNNDNIPKLGNGKL